MLASSELFGYHIADRGRNAEADDVSRVCRFTRAVRPPGITCRGGGGLAAVAQLRHWWVRHWLVRQRAPVVPHRDRNLDGELSLPGQVSGSTCQL